MWFMVHPVMKMKQGLFFVDQSKTASTTLGEVFWHSIMVSRGNIGSVHKTAKFLKFNYGRYWDPYHTFSVIRNPYDRFVSAYFFKNDGWAFDGTVPLCETENVTKDTVLKLMEHPMAYPVRPQTFCITDDNGEVMVDQLILYDNLKEGVTKLVKDFHVPLVDTDYFDRYRFQITKGKCNWKEFYNNYPDFWHLVTDIYRDDIKIFKDLGGKIDRG